MSLLLRFLQSPEKVRLKHQNADTGRYLVPANQWQSIRSKLSNAFYSHRTAEYQAALQAWEAIQERPNVFRDGSPLNHRSFAMDFIDRKMGNRLLSSSIHTGNVVCKLFNQCQAHEKPDRPNPSNFHIKDNVFSDSIFTIRINDAFRTIYWSVDHADEDLLIDAYDHEVARLLFRSLKTIRWEGKSGGMVEFNRVNPLTGKTFKDSKYAYGTLGIINNDEHYNRPARSQYRMFGRQVVA